MDDIEMPDVVFASPSPSQNTQPPCHGTSTEFLACMKAIHEIRALTTALQISITSSRPSDPKQPDMHATLAAIQASTTLVHQLTTTHFSHFGSFILFPLLPVEVRSMIWQQALPGPRLLRVTRFWTKEKDEGNDEMARFTMRSAPLTLSEICSESRAVVLKHYWLRLKPEKVLGPGKSSSWPLPYYLFDPARDTIYIPFSKHACTPVHLVDSVLGHYAAQRLRYLAFDIHYEVVVTSAKRTKDPGGLRIVDFSAFPSLERVDFIAEEQTRRVRRRSFDLSRRTSRTLIDYSDYEDADSDSYRREVDDEWGSAVMCMFRAYWSDRLARLRRDWKALRVQESPSLHFLLRIRPIEDTVMRMRDKEMLFWLLDGTAWFVDREEDWV